MNEECNFNPFVHNVVKWPNILLKSCSVYTARFLKYVWPFYNFMHERLIPRFFMCAKEIH